jgi:chromosomal replication initiator protein
LPILRCIWRAKTLVHQTAGTGPNNLAHPGPADHPEVPEACDAAALYDSGTLRGSLRRPHLWMLVWRTSRPEGLELVTEAQQLWNDCLDSLRSQVSEATWRAWFSSIRPVTVANGTLVLAVPSGVVRDRLEGRFHALVYEALLDSSGKEVQFRFDVQIDDHSPEDVAPPRDVEALDVRRAQDSASVGFVPRNGVSAPARPKDSRGADDVPLNPKYTFDAFVIGPSNRFAHAAALSVAEAPARSYNPLFVYGAAGLGKTHLLQAVGNYIRENFTRMRVGYVSTETFMNEFVETLRAKDDMGAFRRRYRECDVLLIDDVQFMDKKEALQEELFHTFNSLYSASKQIVLTSDRAPRAIATLEDRLRSRLLSGLTTDIQPPELETRIAILRTKAEREHAVVGDDVLDFIATMVKENIRELEGALIRVTAFASLNRQPLTRELAESILADFVAAKQPRQITARQIIETSAGHFGFSVEELIGPSRRRPLVIARQIAMYLFRELTDFSYPAIGREFSDRDHTTVIHAVEKISGLMKERRQVYDQVTELSVQIKNG